MPPKRGKRGRPKKVVEKPDSDEETTVTETNATEEGGSGNECCLDTTASTIVSEEVEIIDDKGEEKSADNKTKEEDSINVTVENTGAMKEDKLPDNVGSGIDDLDNMESMDNMESIENMESMEDNYENMESMEENIENMESMENDEALDFENLRPLSKIDSTTVSTTSELEIEPIKKDTSGSAQYDPSIEDIDSPPEQSPIVDVDQMDTSQSKKDKTVLDVETEAVSEDELPTEITQPPSDTEAVSDEELPPTQSSDPLKDTEDVSDDELPPVKKKKKAEEEKSRDTEKKSKSDSITKSPEKRSSVRRTSDRSLDTEAVSEDDMPSSRKRKSESVSERDRKRRVSVDKDSKLSRKRSSSSSETKDKDSDGSSSKKSSSDSKSSSKALLELEKYWKAVKEDPADFTGWTYLLQYVDQGQDVKAAREAYDAFLSHYPYCYGYWRKYADYEKKKGEKSKSQEVFERGLAAISLSVDLWLHYMNHIKSLHKDDEEYIRQQYDRALQVCGTEFRSDRLWDSYIKWETDCKNIAGVFSVYDKLLTVPTHGYKGHFENFVDFVKANQPNKMLSVDEFLTIRADVLQKLKQKGSSEANPAVNAPPGDESDEETEKSPTFADEETKLMRDKIISLRTKMFKTMSNAVLDRWSYEEAIKRPYFHVKPLERCQLNNWRSYLDYEIEQGDKDRTIVLFERCLIACALYDEFWIKYVRYLETLSGDDVVGKIKNVYERACTIHHPKKPMLSLNWAAFEESQGNVCGAREILIRLEKDVPNSLLISINRINLERRANNLEEASKLYEQYINSNKNKFATNALSIKYARFCQKILNDVEKGTEIMKKAIEKDKDNSRLYHQLFDLLFSRTPRGPDHEEECVSVINQYLDRENIDLEHKLLFAQHKVEFLEDFGSSMSTVQRAVSDYMNLLKQIKDKRRKLFDEKIKNDDKKIKSDSTPTHPPSNPPPNSNGNNSTPNSNFGNFPAGPPQQPPFQNNSNQYPPPPANYGQTPYNNQYGNQADPNFNNYQNWNYQQPAPGYNQSYNQGWGNYNYF